MPVKHWSSAGLMLTSYCPARCACCYVSCGPDLHHRMDRDLALEAWASLVAASPHGCRIHLTGGEPFADWPGLIELAQEARSRGLGPLEKVETNAYWAIDAREILPRLRALDAAGMGKLAISADPYHQQFVPIERCRLLARLAEEILGPARVQVRWREWLTQGQDCDQWEPHRLREAMLAWVARGRDRLGGRASAQLAGALEVKPWRSFADKPCREVVLRGKSVHLAPGGEIFPATCAGLVLGQAGCQGVQAVWQELAQGPANRPILAALADQGPAGLVPWARESGFEPRPGYASKCHLCWDVRSHLARQGLGGGELGPEWVYRESSAAQGRAGPVAEPPRAKGRTMEENGNAVDFSQFD